MSSIARSQGNDVVGLVALGTLLDLELDPLAFHERAVAFSLDGGLVDKDICASIAREKAIALASIKPLDSAGNAFTHSILFLSSKYVDWSTLRTGGKTETAQAEDAWAVIADQPRQELP
jgi:hypothetical protein